MTNLWQGPSRRRVSGLRPMSGRPRVATRSIGSVGSGTIPPPGVSCLNFGRVGWFLPLLPREDESRAERLHTPTTMIVVRDKPAWYVPDRG